MLAQVQPIDTQEVEWFALMTLVMLLGASIVYEVLGAVRSARPGSIRDDRGSEGIAQASVVFDDEASSNATVIAAIGAVTAEALGEVGLPAQVVPERAGARALVEALARHFAARERGDEA